MMDKLSERLKFLREKKGVTQKDVMDVTGIPSMSISNYETGRRKPDYDILIRLADYFNVSLDYLSGRTDTPYQAEHFSELLNEIIKGGEETIQYASLLSQRDDIMELVKEVETLDPHFVRLLTLLAKYSTGKEISASLENKKKAT